MKRIVLAILSMLLLSVVTAGCYFTRILPRSGIWECPELGLTLNLSGGKSYATVEGIAVECVHTSELMANHIGVSYADETVHIEGYYYGKELFYGNCIYAEENKICIRSEDKNEYWFFLQADADNFPREGIWICDELGLALNFDGGKSYIEAGDTTLECAYRHETGSNAISVYYADRTTASEAERFGEEIISGECTFVRGDKMCIRTGESAEFWFTLQEIASK